MDWTPLKLIIISTVDFLSNDYYCTLSSIVHSPHSREAKFVSGRVKSYGKESSYGSSSRNVNFFPICKNGRSLRNCFQCFLLKLFPISRHSDISLVEVGSDAAVKDEDRAVLLEGGALQSGSARSLTASPSIIRFVIHAALVFACLNYGSIFCYFCLFS